jgi:chromosome partitioning protein
MPVISFLSGKGGVGKTTAALILATELSEHTAVTVIDADPNAPFTKWMKQRDDTGNIELINHTAVNMDNIEEVITDAAGRSTFVVVDLEGVKTLLNSYAAGASDLIVIPTQGSQLDAVEAASAIKLVSNLKNPVPFKLLLTRTNSAIRSRTLTNIEGQFAERDIPTFDTQLNERDAFRAMFSFGQSLSELDDKDVPNIIKAKTNARAFAAEVLEELRKAGRNSKPEPTE